ncbi:hypothetical protein DS745_11985 [Anaerobacillus alkaliphilus]|uniref:Uncharacterized protein n=1 Tax=Anaerobacillus alkaliphilus TaxID=1548597 RepID=A0A4Q0VSG2_9BACI|nr:hypothetical protein [Anaerobacillus alkaliphilus]RXJ00247.1 hypothetical protein DS745_11985 [Anaerobacillus alkaliphilus]
MKHNPKQGMQQNTRKPVSKKLIPVLLSASLLTPSILAGGITTSAKELVSGKLLMDHSIQSSLTHNNQLHLSSLKKDMSLSNDVNANVEVTADVEVNANLTDDSKEAKSRVNVEAKPQVTVTNAAATKLNTNKEGSTGEVFIKELEDNWLPTLFKPYYSFRDSYKVYLHFFLTSQAEVAAENLQAATKVEAKTEFSKGNSSSKKDVEPAATNTESSVTTSKGSVKSDTEVKVEGKQPQTEASKPTKPEPKIELTDIGDTEYRPLNVDAKLWLNSELQLGNLKFNTEGNVSLDQK